MRTSYSRINAIDSRRAVKRGFLYEIMKNKFIYLMAVPGILYFFIFSYLPMSGIIIAFKDYDISKGIFKSDWNGFENFKFFFTSGDALHITLNTFYMNVLFLVVGTVFAVAFAILLNEIGKTLFKRITQSLMFLPYFVSWAIVGVIASGLFETDKGAINSLLSANGLEKINWLSTPELWPPILVLFYIWKWTGYSMVIYIATISGIEMEYYEAADIDGASKFQQVWNITVPLLVPTIMILSLLQIGRIFYGDFGMFYSIIGDNGMLFSSTDVIDTYVYRALRQLGEFGMASAVGVYQSVMCFILVFFSNFFAKRYRSEGALF